MTFEVVGFFGVIGVVACVMFVILVLLCLLVAFFGIQAMGDEEIEKQIQQERQAYFLKLYNQRKGNHENSVQGLDR